MNGKSVSFNLSLFPLPVPVTKFTTKSEDGNCLKISQGSKGIVEKVSQKRCLLSKTSQPRPRLRQRRIRLDPHLFGIEWRPLPRGPPKREPNSRPQQGKRGPSGRSRPEKPPPNYKRKVRPSPFLVGCHLHLHTMYMGCSCHSASPLERNNAQLLDRLCCFTRNIASLWESAQPRRFRLWISRFSRPSGPRSSLSRLP